MRRILGVIAVCAVGSSAWGQQVVPAFGPVYPGSGGVRDGNVVYDNSLPANILGFLIDGIDEEHGDGVTLAGTDRIVTNINLQIHANGGNATVDLRIRFYAGGDAGGGNPVLPAFYTSALMPGFAIAGGNAGYNFAVPNVLVPNEFTWTLELTNVTAGGAVGSRFFSPPTTGTSEDWLWELIGGVWTQNVFGVGAGNNNFGATITAIPTPGSLALLAIGGIAMLRRRR